MCTVDCITACRFEDFFNNIRYVDHLETSSTTDLVQ